MKFINIYNINDLTEFSKTIKSKLKLDEVIDKYATLNDYSYMFYINNTQIIIPFTIKKILAKTYCFYAIEPNMEKDINIINTKIKEFNVENLEEINSFNDLQDLQKFNGFIINNKFYKLK